MKKLFSLILGLSLFLQTSIGYCGGWDKAIPEDTDSPSTIGTSVRQNNTALDSMLSNYRRGCDVNYATSSTLTVAIGEVMLTNSAGSSRIMTANTTSMAVSWSDLDTGSEEASQTYYIYAVASSSTATTFTIKISEDNEFPSSVTYARRLGSFYNDSSSNITGVANDDPTNNSWWHAGVELNNNLTVTTAWTDLDLSSIVGSNYALVFLRFYKPSGVFGSGMAVRPNGETKSSMAYGSGYANGPVFGEPVSGGVAYLICETDSSGVIETYCATNTTGVSVTVMGYIK